MAVEFGIVTSWLEITNGVLLMEMLHLAPGARVTAGGSWPVIRVGIETVPHGSVQLFVGKQQLAELDKLIADAT